MPSKNYNPEKRTWRGRSYKKGGERIRELRDSEGRRLLMLETVEEFLEECGGDYSMVWFGPGWYEVDDA